MNSILYVINDLLSVFAFLTVFSYVGIILNLKKYKKEQGLIKNWGILWPSIIFEYKNFTQKKKGKVGILFYIFMVSLSFTILFFIMHSVFSILQGPIYIDQYGNVI
jgi:hypothetical protein